VIRGGSTEPSGHRQVGDRKKAADPYGTRAANTGLLTTADLLGEHEIQCASMSAKALLLGHAGGESFFSTLKSSWILIDDVRIWKLHPSTAKTIWPSCRRATTTVSAAIQRSVTRVRSITKQQFITAPTLVIL